MRKELHNIHVSDIYEVTYQNLSGHPKAVVILIVNNIISGIILYHPFNHTIWSTYTVMHLYMIHIDLHIALLGFIPC